MSVPVPESQMALYRGLLLGCAVAIFIYRLMQCYVLAYEGATIPKVSIRDPATRKNALSPNTLVREQIEAVTSRQPGGHLISYQLTDAL
jgi:hypothetical protein